MSDPVIPAREVFRNFPGVLIALFYIAATLTMAVSGWGLWLRLRRYLRGRSVSRWDALGRRLLRAGLAVSAHTTLGRRNAAVGLAHAGIFWGFVALFVGTLIIMVDYDMVRLVNPAWRFWKGPFYLWYSLLLDVLGHGSVHRCSRQRHG
ncbi:MAG: hypothetical protein AAB328_11625, partial [candidate division NC10 bacterium]